MTSRTSDKSLISLGREIAAASRNLWPNAVSINDALNGALVHLEEAERLRKAALNIPVVGGFSAGKSTFLNKILGQDLLPTQINPTTKAVTRISQGPSACLFEIDGVGARRRITLSEYQQSVDHNSGALDSGGKWKTYEITTKTNIPPGVQLIDTPGWGNTESDRDDAAADNELKRADLAIVLWDANTPEMTREFRERIEQIRSERPDMQLLLVLNRADGKSPSAVKKIYQNSSAQYGKIFGAGIMLGSCKDDWIYDENGLSPLVKGFRAKLAGWASNKQSLKDYSYNVRANLARSEISYAIAEIESQVSLEDKKLHGRKRHMDSAISAAVEQAIEYLVSDLKNRFSEASETRFPTRRTLEEASWFWQDDRVSYCVSTKGAVVPSGAAEALNGALDILREALPENLTASISDARRSKLEQIVVDLVDEALSQATAGAFETLERNEDYWEIYVESFAQGKAGFSRIFKNRIEKSISGELGDELRGLHYKDGRHDGRQKAIDYLHIKLRDLRSSLPTDSENC